MYTEINSGVILMIVAFLYLRKIKTRKGKDLRNNRHRYAHYIILRIATE